MNWTSSVVVFLYLPIRHRSMSKRRHRSSYKASLCQLGCPGVGVAQIVGGVTGGRDVLLQEILRHLGVSGHLGVLVTVRFWRYGGSAGAQTAAGTGSPTVSSLVSKIHLLQHCHWHHHHHLWHDDNLPPCLHHPSLNHPFLTLWIVDSGWRKKPILWLQCKTVLSKILIRTGPMSSKIT